MKERQRKKERKRGERGGYTKKESEGKRVT